MCSASDGIASLLPSVYLDAHSALQETFSAFTIRVSCVKVLLIVDIKAVSDFMRLDCVVFEVIIRLDYIFYET